MVVVHVKVRSPILNVSLSVLSQMESICGGGVMGGSIGVTNWPNCPNCPNCAHPIQVVVKAGDSFLYLEANPLFSINCAVIGGGGAGTEADFWATIWPNHLPKCRLSYGKYVRLHVESYGFLRA